MSTATHLARVVCLLLRIVDEAGLVDLVAAEGCAEVDGSLRASGGSLHVEVIHIETKVIAGELKTTLRLTDLQWQVLKVEDTLQAIGNISKQNLMDNYYYTVIVKHTCSHRNHSYIQSKSYTKINRV